MNEQANVEAAPVEFADDGIDKERHVIVDNVEHGYAVDRSGRLEAHFGFAGFALGQIRPGLFRDGRKLVCGAALQVFRHRQPEKLGQEVIRDIASALGQYHGRGIDQRRAGIVGGGAGHAIVGNVLDVHGPPLILRILRVQSAFPLPRHSAR